MLTRKQLKVNFKELHYVSSYEAIEYYLYPNRDSAEIFVHRVLSSDKAFSLCSGSFVQAVIAYNYGYEFYKHERELLNKAYTPRDCDTASDFAVKGAFISAATKRYYSSIILKALLSLREAGIDVTPDFAYSVAKMQFKRGISTRIIKAVFGDSKRKCSERRTDTKAYKLHNDERAIEILNKARSDLLEARGRVANLKRRA